MSWPGQPISVRDFEELCSSLSDAADAYAELFADGARELSMGPSAASHASMAVSAPVRHPSSRQSEASESAERAGGQSGAARGASETSSASDNARYSDAGGHTSQDARRQGAEGGGAACATGKAGADGAASALPAANERKSSATGGLAESAAHGKRRKVGEPATSDSLSSARRAPGAAGAPGVEAPEQKHANRPGLGAGGAAAAALPRADGAPPGPPATVEAAEQWLQASEVVVTVRTRPALKKLRLTEFAPPPARARHPRARRGEGVLRLGGAHARAGGAGQLRLLNRFRSGTALELDVLGSQARAALFPRACPPSTLRGEQRRSGESGGSDIRERGLVAEKGGRGRAGRADAGRGGGCGTRRRPVVPLRHDRGRPGAAPPARPSMSDFTSRAPPEIDLSLEV